MHFLPFIYLFKEPLPTRALSPFKKSLGLKFSHASIGIGASSPPADDSTRICFLYEACPYKSRMQAPHVIL